MFTCMYLCMCVCVCVQSYINNCNCLAAHDVKNAPHDLCLLHVPQMHVALRAHAVLGGLLLRLSMVCY